MRRTTTALAALTGAAIALSLVGCGGAPAQHRTAVTDHVSLAGANSPAGSGSTASGTGSAAASPALAPAVAPASASHSSSGSGSGRSRHGGRSGSAAATSPGTSPAGSPAAPVAVQPVIAAAKGGTAPIPPPADWPASVPIPAGTITGASGKAPAWIINETVKGVDTVVIARLLALYKKAGFTVDPTISFPKVLRRNRLVLTIVWRNRDHGPEATEVQLNLARV